MVTAIAASSYSLPASSTPSAALGAITPAAARSLPRCSAARARIWSSVIGWSSVIVRGMHVAKARGDWAAHEELRSSGSFLSSRCKTEDKDGQGADKGADKGGGWHRGLSRGLIDCGEKGPGKGARGRWPYIRRSSS